MPADRAPVRRRVEERRPPRRSPAPALDSRRRIGSVATGSPAAAVGPSSSASETARRRSRGGIVGVRRRALLHPAVLERDLLAERADVDVVSPPSGVKRIARSPTRSVRSQIAHAIDAGRAPTTLRL